MISPSFISQISQREFEENVTDDYISGFKERETKYNLKRVCIANLSPNDSMLSETVFDVCELNKDEPETKSNFLIPIPFKAISHSSYEKKNKEIDESTCRSDENDFNSCDFKKKVTNVSNADTVSSSTTDDACIQVKMSTFNLWRDGYKTAIDNMMSLEYHKNSAKKLEPKRLNRCACRSKAIQRSRSRPSDLKEEKETVAKIPFRSVKFANCGQLRKLCFDYINKTDTNISEQEASVEKLANTSVSYENSITTNDDTPASSRRSNPCEFSSKYISGLNKMRKSDALKVHLNKVFSKTKACDKYPLNTNSKSKSKPFTISNYNSFTTRKLSLLNSFA